MQRFLGAALCALALAIVISAMPVFGQTVDPSLDPQIYVCQSCTSPPGGEPNRITDTSGFNVGWAGNHSSLGPLLIIIGVYEGPAPTVSYGGNNYNPGGTAVYGWNGSAGPYPFDSSSSGSAYNAVGIMNDGGGSSQSFGNWATAEYKVYGETPDSFDLYVFELPDDVTLPATPGNITIDTTASSGSYILAYTCETSDNPCTGGDMGATPFTNVGLVGQVPEPASIALLGTVLLVIGGTIRRRLS